MFTFTALARVLTVWCWLGKVESSAEYEFDWETELESLENYSGEQYLLVNANEPAELRASFEEYRHVILTSKIDRESPEIVEEYESVHKDVFSEIRKKYNSEEEVSTEKIGKKQKESNSMEQSRSNKSLLNMDDLKNSSILEKLEEVKNIIERIDLGHESTENIVRKASQSGDNLIKVTRENPIIFSSRKQCFYIFCNPKSL